MTHICVTKITLISSDNGLAPSRRQAIIWTSVGILLIGPLETNFSEILIEIYTFSFKKRHLKLSSANWWPFCLGLNELKSLYSYVFTHIAIAICPVIWYCYNNSKDTHPPPPSLISKPDCLHEPHATVVYKLYGSLWNAMEYFSIYDEISV